MDAFRLHHIKVIEYAIRSEKDKDFKLNTYGVYNKDTVGNSIRELYKAGYIEEKDAFLYSIMPSLQHIPNIKEVPIKKIIKPIDPLESIAKYLCN